MDSVARSVRQFVYEFLRETSSPPVLEQVMRRFALTRAEARAAFDEIQHHKQIVLLPGTERILMAHPFSAIPTPYRVTAEDGRTYFANCSWDSIAIHVALGIDVRIDSFCHQGGETIVIELAHETVKSVQPEGTMVYLALPAARWWQDIIHACSNTMVFFSSRDRLDAWLTLNRIEQPGEALTIEQAIDLSRPIYAGKMEADYERPSPADLQHHFETMGLTGPFWAL